MSSEVDEHRVLVIGGTRGTGFLIAKRLVHQGSRVRVMARDPAAAAARLGSSVEVVTGDITKEQTLPRAIEGATHIVFTASALDPVSDRS